MAEAINNVPAIYAALHQKSTSKAADCYQFRYPNCLMARPNTRVWHH